MKFRRAKCLKFYVEVFIGAIVYLLLAHIFTFPVFYLLEKWNPDGVLADMFTAAPFMLSGIYTLILMRFVDRHVEIDRND